MRGKSKFAAVALGIVVLATLFVSTANAECGPLKGQFKQQSWDGVSDPASLLLVNGRFAEPSIVGMWHVTFTAKGNVGSGAPPDGAPIDNSLVIWHSDGTEMMASARPPQDGNICMGIWEKTGRLTYKLNHIPWLNNDTSNAPSGIGNPAGPTRILENVVLNPDGNHYTGTFTLDAYDTSGNVVAHIIGVIKGTRVTINTTVKNLL
jgi:hypothetical protein